MEMLSFSLIPIRSSSSSSLEGVAGFPSAPDLFSEDGESGRPRSDFSEAVSALTVSFGDKRLIISSLYNVVGLTVTFSGMSIGPSDGV